MEPHPMITYDTLYRRHRFPAEIISHCMWLYFRFCLSYRDIEELMLVRGVCVTYEAIRQWCQKFGQPFANELRRRRPRPGDKWHLDEVFVKINGQQHYLWRAVDQDGIVLDILVQSRRDTGAAKRFFRKLLKGLQFVPRVLITDKLRGYPGTLVGERREVLDSWRTAWARGVRGHGEAGTSTEAVSVRFDRRPMGDSGAAASFPTHPTRRSPAPGGHARGA